MKVPLEQKPLRLRAWWAGALIAWTLLLGLHHHHADLSANGPGNAESRSSTECAACRASHDAALIETAESTSAPLPDPGHCIRSVTAIAVDLTHSSTPARAPPTT